MSCWGSPFCHVTVEILFRMSYHRFSSEEVKFVLCFCSEMVDTFGVPLFLFLILSCHELLIGKCLFVSRVTSLVCFCSWLYVNAVVIACDAFPVKCLVHMLLLRNSWWDICFSGNFHQTAFFQYFLFFHGFIYQVWTFPRTVLLCKYFLLKLMCFPGLDMTSGYFSSAHVEDTRPFAK